MRSVGPYEIHDQLERTFTRIADGVRECPEANSGGFHPMEGARQFQDRDVRDPSRRLGRLYDGRLRRSADRSQVLLNAACFCIRSAASGPGYGRRPRRA